MARARYKVALLTDWHRIKGSHHRGKIVEAVACHRAGLGLLCEVMSGSRRIPAVLRSHELSWNPREQTPDSLDLHVPFRAAVVGYDDEWRELILSKKAAEPGPFERFVLEHKVGSVVVGTVEKVLTSAYVVSLDGDVEGILPKRNVPEPPEHAKKFLLADAKLDALLVGDRITAVVAAIDQVNRRIEVNIRRFLAQQDEDSAREIQRIRNRSAETPALVVPRADSESSRGKAVRSIAAKKLTILLLEDDQDELSSVSLALECRTHRVIGVRTITEARNRLAELKAGKQTLDVALIDIQLDGELGSAIFAELKRDWPACRRYAFSGNLDYFAIRQAQGVEAESPDGFILKPISYSDLIATVEGHAVPRSTQRMFSIEQALQVSSGDRSVDGASVCPAAGQVIHGYLEAVRDRDPNARAAVLSFSPESNLITCIEAMGIRKEQFVPYESRLAFTPLGNVLMDRTPKIEAVESVSATPSVFTDFMTSIRSGCVQGVPLQVDWGQDVLGLFVFALDRTSFIPREVAREVDRIANNLSLAIERSFIDASLARTQLAICVGGLLQGMAHELRNTVQSLLTNSGTVELALDASEPWQHPTKAREDVAWNAFTAIRSGVSNLKSNLESFLQIMKSGGSEPWRLGEMIQDVVVHAKGAAGQNEITLDWDVSSQLAGVEVVGILRQALLNLALNAIQHAAISRTEHGLVQIYVSEGKGVEGDSRQRFVDVRIKDNAWGLHWARRGRVFDMFHTTRKQGSGLGLYVTRLIIEGVGGQVTVEESIRFVGTTFLVRLPLN